MLNKETIQKIFGDSCDGMDTMEDREIDIVLRNIKASAEGPQFVRFLQLLSWNNYEAFKQGGPDTNEAHKGFAVAIDSLIKMFAECDMKDLSEDKEQFTDEELSELHS